MADKVCSQKRRIVMYRFLGRSLKLLALAVLLLSVLPARAQVAVQTSDFSVPPMNATQVVIHVHHKFGPAPLKIPVLLIHGTWGNSGTWDFPGRSVMDYLAIRGYDVYALDLRGMGKSDNPGYATIDIINRVNDVVAVAQYIAAPEHTGRQPVVMGWSQGGVLAGLVAASDPNGHLIAGVGLLSVAPYGFVVPTNLQGTLLSVVGQADFLPNPLQVNEIVFGTDPITGKPTISPAAFSTFVSVPEFLQLDSVKAILEEVNLCPLFLGTPFVNGCPVAPPPLPGIIWSNVKVPALVVDGALDLLVGEDQAQMLFTALGSANKQLIVFPRNSHGWFLEDNHDETDKVFDHFLSQFGH
jgi:pimeloyl-ACP methyl ester carboxylesterase